MNDPARNDVPVRVLHVQASGDLQNGINHVVHKLLFDRDTTAIEAHVLVPEEGDLTEALIEIGVPVHVVAANAFPGPSPSGLARYLAGVPGRSRQIAGIIRDNRIDVVHSHSLYHLDGAFASRLSGRPHIWHLHNPYSRDTVARALAASAMSDETIAAFYASTADQFIAVSRHTAHALRSQSNAEPMEVIHNAIDVAWFDREAGDPAQNALRAELNVPDDAPIVASVGRIFSQKDLPTFIRVAAEVVRNHPRALFIHVGAEHDTSLAAELRASIEQLGLERNVRLLGPRTDILRLYRQFSMLLITSLYEGFSLVCLEAMTAGIPVVSTRCGGVEEVIVDGTTGLLAPVGDHEDLARRVTQLLNDPASAEHMGRAGRERASTLFTPAKSREKLLRLYRNLMDRHPASGNRRWLTGDALIALLATAARQQLAAEVLEARVRVLEAQLQRWQDAPPYRALAAINRLAGRLLRTSRRQSGNE